MDTKQIGQRIRAARQAAGLTQEDVGRKIGFSQVQVSAYERGDVTGITLEVIDTIARATRHPLAFFIGEAPRLSVTLAEILRQQYPDIEPETIREIESFCAWAIYRDRQARSAGTTTDETSDAGNGNRGG